MRRLEGKVALVTGGARGIGRAICEAFIREGARVAVADLLDKEAADAASALGEAAMAVPMDVTDLSSISGGVSAVEDAWGGIDILVNNAGIFNMCAIEEITPEDYRRQYDVNVGGTIFMTQAVVPGMKKRGRGGKIINFSSQAGRRGEAYVLVYCSTKAAVISITQSTGLELIKHGINVNAIAPGVVDGEHGTHVDSMFARLEATRRARRRPRSPQAVPRAALAGPTSCRHGVFLASDEADYIVSQTYNVDGGQWMS